MRKYFHGSALFLCILALCGCGGSAADPMGTGTVQFVDGSGSVITSAPVSPGGSVTLIAKVTNLRSDGTAAPVVNEKVSFSMVTAGKGGGVAVVNDRTASGGQAMAVYTAGNNMASDTVRVTTDVGATATIVITKSGGTADARIATLTPSSSAVKAGQTSVVTANVTDGNSNPMWGETVTFTLPVNESGAGFINASGVSVSSIPVLTDASGNAVAIYKAGSNDSLAEVYDTVRGALANGSSNAMVITRSPPKGYSITVGPATPTVPLAGGSSVITANVKNNGAGVNGVTVNFVTTAGGVSPSSAITDSSGNAETVFTTAAAGLAGETAGVVTASITVDGSPYTASVVVTYK